MISHNWSPMKRLIWLRGSGITGGSGTWDTISGNPVSFTAKAAPLRQLSVAFSPVQSLNGYDAPWPAGGGVNKFNKDADISANAFYVDSDGAEVSSNNYRTTDYIPVKPNTAYYWAINGVPPVSSPPSHMAPRVAYYDSAKNWLASGDYLGDYGSAYASPATAAYARLPVYTARPETFATAMFVEGNALPTTYSPYSNICPISGWDGVKVWRTGKNLYYYDATKATTGETTAGTIRGYYPLGLRNCTLTFSASLIEGETPTPGNINIGKLSNGKLSVLNDFLTPSAIRQRTFTFAADEEAVLMSVATNTWGITDNLPRYNIMVEIGETAHDYEAFNGTSISISLGQTVYSGWVDVISGVGEVTGVKEKKKLSEATSVTAYTNTDYYRFNDFFSADIARNNRQLSNIALYGYNTLDEAHFYSEGTAFRVWVAIGAADTTEVECYAELATPIPIQLTPQEVQSLAGDNTMWSNANQPITVTYRSN